MARLRLVSNFGESVLIESEEPGGHRWLVSLRSSDLSASAEVQYGSYHPAGRVGAFFDDLACHWRGWSGEKTWRSTDDHLHFTALHDGLGHIALRTMLRDRDWPGERWTVELCLTFDAGALDAIARDVDGFDRD